MGDIGPTPDNPEITLSLDRERTYRLDFNAIRIFERTTGLKLQEDLGAMGFEGLTALIWAGLLDEDPELTLHQVGRLLTLANSGPVMDRIRDLMQAASAKPDAVQADAEGNPPVVSSRHPTGSTSGPSASTTSG